MTPFKSVTNILQSVINFVISIKGYKDNNIYIIYKYIKY